MELKERQRQSLQKQRIERDKHGEKEKKRKRGGRREMEKISGLTGEIHLPEIC